MYDFKITWAPPIGYYKDINEKFTKSTMTGESMLPTLANTEHSPRSEDLKVVGNISVHQK